MSLWLLDDKPFDLLAKEFDAGWAWPASTLHVMDAVARAASRDHSGRRARLLGLSTAAGEPCVEQHAIIVGTPAAEHLFTHLRAHQRHAEKSLADDEAIAWCRVHREFDFVSMDKKAMYLALSELGPGRVYAPFDVWIDLAARGLITIEQAERLCERTAKESDPNVPPPPRIEELLTELRGR